MIDLSKYSENGYKIKLEDGKILTIKAPTQGQLRKLFDIQEQLANKTIAEGVLLDTLYQLMTEIFNRNLDSISFTLEQIEDMLPLAVLVEVLQDYLKETVNGLGE